MRGKPECHQAEGFYLHAIGLKPPVLKWPLQATIYIVNQTHKIGPDFSLVPGGPGAKLDQIVLRVRSGRRRSGAVKRMS